ncbi:hypothetical protein APHAL10511_001350 [Amanita phalloides]|nr:hypothetical protein APHAL10511_001350 [Amanita phalloides]
MQVIDGGTLEGGGQILRNAIALSALLRRSVTIENIRKDRKSPGLKNQHRTGLELASTIASAKLTGAYNSSTQVVFEPGDCSQQHVGQEFMADAVTAGSTMLLLQIALPILLFNVYKGPLVQLQSSAIKLTLKGGTNAELAPQVDYTHNVFLLFLQKHFLAREDSTGMNATIEVEVERRGYYPKGGGVVHIHIKPLLPGTALQPVKLRHYGRVLSIRGIAHYAGLPTSIGKDMVRGALERLRAAQFMTDERTSATMTDDNAISICVEQRREPRDMTTGAGNGIVLWAELEGGGYVGGSAVGRKGMDPRHVGSQAAEELVKSLNKRSCVDEWLQDQIIIFMALAQGISEVCCGTQELSLHTRSAILD